ncbi:MAG: CBS domain-containing protein [Gammaproteobacteria bacterium]
MITVEEVMSTGLSTLTEQDTLSDARKLMSEAGIHHVPIVNGDTHLVGLVSHRDVLAVSESKLSEEQIVQNPGAIGIGDFMTRDVATVDRHANLRQAAVFLEKHQYGCLPVVEDEILIGIITDSDFVGVAINLLEQIEDLESEDL